MEITTLLGIIVGIIAVVGAMIFKHISFTVFINPAAFFVIFVGTVATILNSYPGENLKSLGSLFKILFTKRKGISEVEIIRLMVELSNVTRKEGLLSLEGRLNDIEDPFIRKGLRLVVDGMDEEVITDILGAEISAMEARHEVNASIFSSAGMYAPTLGVLGAVFGLIAAMSHIDDTEAMAEAIAAAFIATILGIFTGYVLWNPFAKKLKVKSHEEALIKGMAIEGILSLQKGESPLMVQEKLLSVLPYSKQEKILGELNQE
ncbi:flagellar motor stator protein MotA [Anaerocolumna sedimenticola]|uniref:Flagellar motor stator protein MotA n=1 Tax=Anaerocolumna sedimenticola TaxID=2696063 RepID=A0A6P1TP44_9FIRM|nr:flagellar motor stator protein MotA [Anaerocolumna sedimenticola]QHQ62107.1 flagellar motor stator protein MotA [Anaerocolumna sedimenticola]